MAESAPASVRPMRSCIWPGCRADIGKLAPNTSYCFPHKRSRESQVTAAYRQRKRQRGFDVVLVLR